MAEINNYKCSYCDNYNIVFKHCTIRMCKECFRYKRIDMLDKTGKLMYIICYNCRKNVSQFTVK